MKVKGKEIKPVWVVVAGVVIVGIGYGIYRLIQNSTNSKSTELTAKAKQGGLCKYQGFPLRYGSCGKEVEELQKILNQMIKVPHQLLKVDGKFGEKTAAMSKYYLGKDSFSQVAFYMARMSGRSIIQASQPTVELKKL